MKPKAFNPYLPFLAAWAFCLMGNAHAQADAGRDALYVKSLAATCANCHGTNGKSAEGSSVPSLAGLGRAYHIAQMTAFKKDRKSVV